MLERSRASERAVAVAVSGRGLVGPGEGVFAVDDEGFSRGRAAFETLRVYAGRPFRLDEHLDRLESSVHRLGFAPPDRTELAVLVGLALDEAALADSVLRLFHTPGPPGAAPVTVALVEDIPGEWRILEESAKHEAVNAFRARWEVSVPAEGSAKLTYAVRIKY